MAITITKPAVNISERLSNLDGISLENFKAMNPEFKGKFRVSHDYLNPEDKAPVNLFSYDSPRVLTIGSRLDEEYDPTTNSDGYLYSPKGTKIEIYGRNETPNLVAGNLITFTAWNTTGTAPAANSAYIGAVADTTVSQNGSANIVFGKRTGPSTWEETTRIDTAGNLLVGKDALAIGTAGIEARASGQLLATADGDNPVDFNRKTSDGNIALFRKDGSPVGRIGVDYDTEFYIGGGGGGFYINTISIRPTTGGDANTLSDNSHDLGSSSHRFKDLYLSGGVKFGTGGATSGTGTEGTDGNYLDDYEEGTFTATLRGATEPGTLITTTATYTKIGNRVFIIIAYENVNTTGYTGTATIEGLPFNCSQDRAVLYLAAYNGLTWTDTPLAAVSSGVSTLSLQDQVSGAVWQNVNHNASSAVYIWITGHYIAT